MGRLSSLAWIFCVCLFYFLFVGASRAEDSVDHFLLEGATHDSQLYKGQTLHFFEAHNVNSEMDLQVGAENLNRTYIDGTKLQDTIFNLGLVTKQDRTSYLESEVTASSTAEIYSRWSVHLTPHLIEGLNDFGLGVKYAEYAQSKDFTLNPSDFYSISDDIGVGAGAFIVESYNLIAAYQLQARWKVLERHSFKVIGAWGRTIEDAGLEANFTSFTGQYFYNFTPSWRVEFTFVNYRSDVRKEQSFGVGIGYR